MESSTYLLKDEKGKDHAIFTGDTLFIGDVGRPDLAVKSELSKEDLAGELYDSLHDKILPLSDEVLVYPGHGAGSACGKSMSSKTFSTLGEQRRENYALQAQDKQSFIDSVLEGLHPSPSYFAYDVKMNKEGYKPIQKIRHDSSKKLSLDEFKGLVNKKALVFDSRMPPEFEKGFFAGSYNIGRSGQYAILAATLLPMNQDIILIVNDDKAEELVDRLAYVGFENIKGYIPFEMMEKEGIQSIKSIGTNEFIQMKDSSKILDVRMYEETHGEHLKGAMNLPLDRLETDCDCLKKDDTYLVYCGSGYKSMVAASILKRQGFEKVLNIKGGIEGMKKDKSIDITKDQYATPITSKGTSLISA